MDPVKLTFHVQKQFLISFRFRVSTILLRRTYRRLYFLKYITLGRITHHQTYPYQTPFGVDLRSNESHKSEILNKHDIQNGVIEFNLKNMFLTHFRFRAYKTLIRRTYSQLNF